MTLRPATDAPLLSYIVLSYNYEDYIGQTIRSILDQTVADLEVVVVDDCSRDRSVEVVESFGDPRIRLIRNERNLGGAGSYNVAVTAARGTWLVNLDADDWILPHKAEAQLAAATADPRLDVIGTHVAFVGADGAPHPHAARHEEEVNADRDLNRIGSWIGRNPLCRSSTMVRRAAHLRVGLDDAAMVRAPDYELWTRFLAAGSRFAVLREKLTCYRLQSRGVTFADPLGTMLEMAWVALRNLVPLIEARAAWTHLEHLLRDLVVHPELASLGARERERLLGLFLTGTEVRDYAAFRALLTVPDPALERLGRRVLALSQAIWQNDAIARLQRDVVAIAEARDFWKGQTDNWETEARTLQREIERLHGEIAAMETSRDEWAERCRICEEKPRDGTTIQLLRSVKRRSSRFFRS